MKIPANVAVAAAITIMAAPALAGRGGPRHRRTALRFIKDGFGYPALRPSYVYLGNGLYAIPR